MLLSCFGTSLATFGRKKFATAITDEIMVETELYYCPSLAMHTISTLPIDRFSKQPDNSSSRSYLQHHRLVMHIFEVQVCLFNLFGDWCAWKFEVTQKPSRIPHGSFMFLRPDLRIHVTDKYGCLDCGLIVICYCYGFIAILVGCEA